MDQLVPVSALLAAVGALLAGLGVFFWGVRHVLAARAELDASRSTAVGQRRATG